mgnify:CR=1 FL=1
MSPVSIILIVVFSVILGIALIIFLACIRIVPQAHEYVIERWGKYKRTLTAGGHLLVPFAERTVKKVTLMEQILDSAPQSVITKDNVTMQIDSVVYFKIFDAKLYCYGAVNPIQALDNLSATTLRNIVGDLDLDDTLTSRDIINAKMTQIIDKATDEWGIRVTRVELKNIIPPKEIRDAMEKQMKAERDRRETLLEAEGHKQAVITRAEGDKQAAILQAEGERDARIARAEGEAKEILLKKQAEADGLKALMSAKPTPQVLELKRYETLAKVADGKASKIIVPTDIVDVTKKNILFSETTGIGDVTDPAEEEEEKEKEDPCCDKKIK